ncbi:hypothetical protein MGSAQ_001015 [marine sediment metagenome]|uniref:Uncharacterized protein n=1 Tax=marine sediment metagenome TaxID=412755 RepID=A0A1B6NVK2_9ZZZZ
MEVLLIDSIILSECSFRLIPKVLNAIDVIVFTANKLYRVIDSEMFKLAHIQCIVTSIAIRINKAVRLDVTLNGRH